MTVPAVRIPHDRDLSPGTWMLVNNPNDRRHGQPVHRCPQCKIASAMINHSVEPDGTVHASIACFAPCTFHVMGVLDGWTYGKKESGKAVAL